MKKVISYRVYCERSTWQSVYTELQSRDYNLSQISSQIGAHFSDQVHRGQGLNEKSFRKLEELIGYSLPIIQKKSILESITLEPSVKLAELFGIILGDGHLSNSKYRYRLQIALNSAKEPEYISYVENIIINVFGEIPSRYQFKKRNCLVLMVSAKPLIMELLRLGLKRGNKIKNQVRVPNWIKQNKEFSIACTKGLIDSDGSVTISKNNQLKVEFANKSIPLRTFFEGFCKNNSIETRRYGIIVNVRNIKSMFDFIKLVKPMKAEYRNVFPFLAKKFNLDTFL